MSGRPKILFVAPVEPWCRENGSSLITADLLVELGRLDGIELFPIFIRKPPPGYERGAPAGLEGILLDIEGLPKWASTARAVLRRSSPLRHRFDNEGVTERIAEAIDARDFRPDLVHVEHLPLVDIGLALSRARGCPVAYRAHNVESYLWARRLGLPRLLREPVIAHMMRAEVDAVRAVDLTLLISEVDLRWARTSAPDARSELLPCSLRLERYDSVRPLERLFRKQICFVGGLDWGPNEDGLRWFVTEVLPLVTQRMPEAGLAVLSRGADRREWLRANPSVRIVAHETSAPELFAGSDVSIAPLFQGGGVRIKIAESLALECPVVATEIGAEGHELPGVVKTDDPATFAAACLDYLEGAPARGDGALRRVVEERYGAARHARRLVDLWSQLVARERSGAPAR